MYTSAAAPAATEPARRATFPDFPALAILWPKCSAFVTKPLVATPHSSSTPLLVKPNKTNKLRGYIVKVTCTCAHYTATESVRSPAVPRRMLAALLGWGAVAMAASSSPDSGWECTTPLLSSNKDAVPLPPAPVTVT